MTGLDPILGQLVALIGAATPQFILAVGFTLFVVDKISASSSRKAAEGRLDVALGLVARLTDKLEKNTEALDAAIQEHAKERDEQAEGLRVLTRELVQLQVGRH